MSIETVESEVADQVAPQTEPLESTDLESMERNDSIIFLIYVLIYFVMFFISFFMLRQYSKYDTVFGFISYMRTKMFSEFKIKLILILSLLWLFAMPIIFAITWGLNLLKDEEVDRIQASSVAMTVIVSSLVMLSFSSWYGTKWHLSRLVGALLIISAVSGWLFSLLIQVLP